MGNLLIRMKYRVHTGKDHLRGSIPPTSPLFVPIDMSPDKRQPGITVKQAQDRFTLLG